MHSLFVLFVAFGVFSQGSLKKPVSISYEAVLQCFPDAEDQSLSQKVDLNRLRERLDLFLVTDRKRLEKRVVKFKDESGVVRRVTLEERADPKNPLLGQQLNAQWETLSESGASVSWDPGLPKKFTMMDVNQIFAKGLVLGDDRIDFDTKLKGITMRVRRAQSRVVEIKLDDVPNKRTLSCEDRGETGSICLCTKKDDLVKPGPQAMKSLKH